MQYYGTLYFGTPPQPFTTVFSTEQAWTWLNDVSCGEKCHPAVHAFNSSESSTFEGTTESKEVESGSKGQGTALLAFETVRLSPKRGVVTGQAFLLMQESTGLTALSADGYTVSYTQGLAFSKLSEWHDTFLGSLKKQGLISLPSTMRERATQPWRAVGIDATSVHVFVEGLKISADFWAP